MKTYISKQSKPGVVQIQVKSASKKVASPVGKNLPRIEARFHESGWGNDHVPAYSSSWPSIQAKLEIGSPNNKYEREADATAAKVMSMPNNGPVIQRQCQECGENESMNAGSGSVLNQKEAPLRLKPLQMKSYGEGGSASSHLASKLNSPPSAAPLNDSTNQFMSQAFGTDFSNVRVHTGSEAIQMNQELRARAFTYGADIYFNKGEYAPQSQRGKKLLAHELTHVEQQKKGNRNAIQRLKIKDTQAPAPSICGSFSYFWNYELDKGAPCEGFLVQQVTILETKAGCDEAPVNSISIIPKENFWESWHHKKGDKLDVDHAKYGYTDNFQEPTHPGSTGNQVNFGDIKFFCIKMTGDLNTLWSPNHYSGGLPSTKSEPGWWKDAPIESASHEVDSLWDCCNGKSESSINHRT